MNIADRNRRHIFKDLQPYICTFESCLDMLITFPTRKLWSDHEFSVHRNRHSFNCHQCRQELETEEIFRQHLGGAHSMHLNDKQFLAAASAARVTAQKPVIDEQCPLCLKSGLTSVRAFTTHVGRHMEGIALASLPREDGSDSEAEDESQSTRSQPRSKASGSSQGPRKRLIIVLKYGKKNRKRVGALLKFIPRGKKILNKATPALGGRSDQYSQQAVQKAWPGLAWVPGRGYPPAW
jgi:hypothetical protein